MFSEERQTLAAGATEATLHDIEQADDEQHCLARQSKPFHVSVNLGTADMNQKNKRRQLHALQTTGYTQTSATSASLSLPQLHGYHHLVCCSSVLLCR